MNQRPPVLDPRPVRRPPRVTRVDGVVAVTEGQTGEDRREDPVLDALHALSHADTDRALLASFGREWRGLREAERLSADELAARLSGPRVAVSADRVLAWEQGQRWPDGPHLDALQRAFDLPEAEILALHRIVDGSTHSADLSDAVLELRRAIDDERRVVRHARALLAHVDAIVADPSWASVPVGRAHLRLTNESTPVPLTLGRMLTLWHFRLPQIDCPRCYTPMHWTSFDGDTRTRQHHARGFCACAPRLRSMPVWHVPQFGAPVREAMMAASMVPISPTRRTVGDAIQRWSAAPTQARVQR